MRHTATIALVIGEVRAHEERNEQKREAHPLPKIENQPNGEVSDRRRKSHESRTRKDTIVPAPDAAAAPFAALDALLVTALATAAALTLVAMLQQKYNSTTKNNTYSLNTSKGADGTTILVSRLVLAY